MIPVNQKDYVKTRLIAEVEVKDKVKVKVKATFAGSFGGRRIRMRS